MWSMAARRKKRTGRDSIGQGELPLLWPDEHGSLHLGTLPRAPSNGLRLRHLPRSSRREVVRASRLLRSRFLSSWLSSRNSGAAGFGAARESLFEMWLSRLLENSAFNALELGAVIQGASADLVLDAVEVLRLMVKVTRRTARFKSDGELITFR